MGSLVSTQVFTPVFDQFVEQGLVERCRRQWKTTGGLSETKEIVRTLYNNTYSSIYEVSGIRVSLLLGYIGQTLVRFQ